MYRISLCHKEGHWRPVILSEWSCACIDQLYIITILTLFNFLLNDYTNVIVYDTKVLQRVISLVHTCTSPRIVVTDLFELMNNIFIEFKKKISGIYTCTLYPEFPIMLFFSDGIYKGWSKFQSLLTISLWYCILEMIHVWCIYFSPEIISLI